MTAHNDLSKFLSKRHPPRSPQKWTPAEDARLTELFGQGKTNQQIADIMGRGYDSVRYRRYVLSIPYVPSGHWTPERDRALADLIEGGLRYSEAAKRLNVTLFAAKSRGAALGLSCHYHWLPVEIEFLRENWMKLTTAKLAKRLGKSPGAVYEKARNIGLPKRGKVK